MGFNQGVQFGVPQNYSGKQWLGGVPLGGFILCSPLKNGSFLYKHEFAWRANLDSSIARSNLSPCIAVDRPSFLLLRKTLETKHAIKSKVVQTKRLVGAKLLLLHFLVNEQCPPCENHASPLPILADCGRRRERCEHFKTLLTAELRLT